MSIRSWYHSLGGVPSAAAAAFAKATASHDEACGSRPCKRSRALGCFGGVAIVLTCGVLAGTPVSAQAPAPDARANQIASDPIKCWWRTDKSAVEIGEQFTLTLTCGVIETRRVTVVPKTDQLDPAALQLPPFEVLGGTSHEDIQDPPWRYFQYEYTVRLVGQDFFGQDVDIPALTVTYSILSDVVGAAEGRDQMYLLPALPIRIASLVPKKATDIRDSTRESFGEVEGRLFRATTELISAAILFGFAVLMLAFAAVRIIRRARARAPVLAPVVPAVTLLRACLRELGRLKSEVTREGWTPERTGSALTVLRIGSAVAMRRPIAHSPVDANVPAREGQLALRKGILSRKRILVSAPTTSDAVERYRANGNGQAPNGRMQAMVEDLCESLQTFSTVRYGRNGKVDTAALDRALENGRIALQRLRRATLWPMRAAGVVARSAGTLRSSVWTR